MTEAGDREQLGRALEHAEDDGLEGGDQLLRGESEHEVGKGSQAANERLSRAVMV
jgi:hypothetical protein